MTWWMDVREIRKPTKYIFFLFSVDLSTRLYLYNIYIIKYVLYMFMCFSVPKVESKINSSVTSGDRNIKKNIQYLLALFHFIRLLLHSVLFRRVGSLHNNIITSNPRCLALSLLVIRPRTILL